MQRGGGHDGLNYSESQGCHGSDHDAHIWTQTQSWKIYIHCSQSLVQWQMLCLSPLVTQLRNVRIWPLWSHMRLSVEHRDHPLLHPPLLLLHWGPRRILTLAVAARNEQHHKDSVIPRTTDWQKPQLTGTSRLSAKVRQEGTKCSVDYPWKKK